MKTKWMQQLWILALVLVVGALPTLQPRVRAADRSKPVAVLSVASVDRLMGDLDYLTKASGRADVGGMLRFMAFSMVQDLDRTRPAGVIITMVDGEPKGVGFLPVPDLDKFLLTMKDKFSAGVEDLDNGVKKLEMGRGAFLKQQGEWLYFTDDERHLSNLPNDPASVLGGLSDQYDVAIRLFVQNIPAPLRELAIDQIESGIELGLQPSLLSGGSGVDEDLTETLHENTLKTLKMLINDSDQVTIGWAVDGKGRRTYLDLTATAVPGSTLADHFGLQADCRSSLTGFLLPDAAAVLHAATRISPDDSSQVSALVEFMRKKAMTGIDEDPGAPAALKDIVNQVLDVIVQTASEGKTDFGAAVVLAPKSFKFVGGVQVADGAALAGAFQKLIELARNEPDVPDVKFYADKHRDVDFHTFTVPIPDHEKDARNALGDKLDVVIGTGAKSLFLGFGTGSGELLKKVIDKSAENGEQPVPITQFRVALKPLMGFLKSVKVDDPKLSTLADAIADADGGDAIALTVKPTDNGVTYRLQVDEGVLSMVGKASNNQK